MRGSKHSLSTVRPGCRFRLNLCWARLGITALLLAGSSAIVQAHKPSDSYLFLRIENSTIHGQWDLALRDLEYAIGLDANGDGEITWRELRDQHQSLAAYALSRLELKVNGATSPLRITEHLVDQHSDGAYAVIRFAGTVSRPAKGIEVTYRALFDIDPQHRGLLKLDYGNQTQTAVFSPEQPTQYFEVLVPNLWKQFFSFVGEGVWHILIGYDHILFLLALLLPSVLHRELGAWTGVEEFRSALINVLKIVTAFTVAHSITLSLATLGIIRLPSRWIESAIAASVVLAALNNVHPFFHGRGWIVAFCFGLIHGFGFANVLMDLGLQTSTLIRALVGFNLGVEAGQLAIVSVFLPLAYGLRRSWFYRCLTFKLGSIGIAVIAATWMSERLFNFKVLPF